MNRVDSARIVLDVVFALLPEYQKLLYSDRDWMDNIRMDSFRCEIKTKLISVGFSEKDVDLFIRENSVLE